MLLRELGMLSARYAEAEGLVAKHPLPSSATPVEIPVPVSITFARQDLLPKTSTIVTAPVPPIAAVQSTPAKARSPALSSVSSASLPESPICSNSPLCTSTDCAVPAVIPFLAQRASFPVGNKLQQLGLSFMPMAPAFNPATVSTPQGLLVQTPMGLTQISAVPATMLATAPPFVPVPQMEAVTSVSSARLRKPFHKRRPAHMDKSMLICHFCGRRETPEWRKGPGGPATLCNACGLQWAKKVRAQRNSASPPPCKVVAEAAATTTSSSQPAATETKTTAVPVEEPSKESIAVKPEQ